MCINNEPNIQEHKSELIKIKNLNLMIENINKIKNCEPEKNSIDYLKLEIIAEKILKFCPEFSDIKQLYIESLLFNGKISDAMTIIIENLNDEEKINEDFEYLMALALFYNNKFENAKKFILSIPSVKNKNKFKILLNNIKETELQKEKANEKFKNKEYAEAIQLYSNVLEIDLKNKNFNSTIYANRALCHQKQNKIIEALCDINKSIILNPSYIKAYMRRGQINLLLFNYEESIVDFLRVKELDPTNIEIDKLLEESKKRENLKKDYYKILNINPTSSDTEIKKAFRKLAMKWHPDKNNESEEQKKYSEKMFKDINEAYSILQNRNEKELYDKTYENFENNNYKENLKNEMYYMYNGFNNSREEEKIIFNFSNGTFSSGGRMRSSSDPFSSFFQ